MEFRNTREHIRKYTALVDKKCSELQTHMTTDTDFFKLQIWKKLDESKNISEFLDIAGLFYEEIKHMSEGALYTPEQAAELRDIIILFTEAVMCPLTYMYDRRRYEDISRLELFGNLTRIPAFSLGMYLVNEGVAYWKEETHYQETRDEKDAFAETEENLILELVNMILSSGSRFRYILYMNFKETCWWSTDCGLMTRDRCLAILLRYFCNEDSDAELVLAINKLISPGKESRNNSEDEKKLLDRVIVQSFGALPDELKQDIIEQCSYRDLFKELPEAELPGTQIDPCPEKVLEPDIRRHVSSMIKTMWQHDGEIGAKQRERMKFNCIDCAYVSAKLKKYVSEVIRTGNDQSTPLIGGEVTDNHDNGNRMSPIFNIVISGIHVMIMVLRGGEDEKENALLAEQINDKAQKGMELQIRFYSRDAEGKKEEYSEKQYTVPFQVDDWELVALRDKLKTGKFSETVTEYSKSPKGADFRYSLIYLEKYRGIEHITISFDHKYELSRNKKKKIIRLTKEKTNDRPDHFYEDKVVSLTGFVGKNGAGKSSVVDFLRDSFLRICKDIYNNKIEAKKGVVDIKPEKLKSYRLKEDTRFFVIFHFNGKYFYLTNLLLGNAILPGRDEDERLVFANETQTTNTEDTVSPYDIYKLLPIYSRNRKIVYFSQFLSPNGVADVEKSICGGGDETGQLSEERQGSIFEVGEKKPPKKDKEEGIIDLSEETLNSFRKTLPEQSLNISLVMQLVFYYSQKDALKVYFPEDFLIDDLEVMSRTLGHNLRSRNQDIAEKSHDSGIQSGVASAFIRDLRELELEAVLLDRTAYVRPFSSGQYSKFALLSRLYWCIKGWKQFKNVLSERGFDEERVFGEPLSWKYIRDEIVGLYLQDTDSAVLFFDEADTYYHPEWQRKFVSDILKMVKDDARKEPLQIVFTTNAPLMLSDLRQEDIYLMKVGGQGESGSSLAKDESFQLNPSVPTFAQNIHTLMAKPFFLDRTIGEFANERIKWLIGLLIDVTDIVCSLKDLSGRSKKYKDFISKLKEKQGDIYNKTIVVLEAYKNAEKTYPGNEEEIRIYTGTAEGKYVAAEIRKKFYADTEQIKPECVQSVLKKHIDLIGEGVLRNELKDMYKDFVLRTKPYFEKEQDQNS